MCGLTAWQMECGDSMNTIIQLLTYMVQMAICNQVHKAENYSKVVQSMKSSLLALHCHIHALCVYMNE